MLERKIERPLAGSSGASERFPCISGLAKQHRDTGTFGLRAPCLDDVLSEQPELSEIENRQKSTERQRIAPTRLESAEFVKGDEDALIRAAISVGVVARI